MKKLNDEILNKYIDGELDAAEISELKNLINENPEQLRILKAHKLVDETLPALEIYPAPHNFTERMMNIIYDSAGHVRPKVSGFFIGVVSVFVASILGTLFYSLSAVPASAPNPTVSEYVDKGESFLKSFLSGFSGFVGSENMTLLGGALTVILLISGYFLFESHKKFKDKLTGASR